MAGCEIMKPYHKGFWDWCKDNYPQVILHWHREMKKGMDELEKFVEEIEEKHGGNI